MAVGPFAVLRFDLAFSLLGPQGAGRFLDLGCGAGDFTLELVRRGYHGTAIDPSEQAVARTAERVAAAGAEGVEVALGTVLDVTGPFNTVFAFEVIEHIADDVSLLRKIRTVLAPGGRLVLSTPAHQGLWDDTDAVSGHVRRYEHDDLVVALQAAGYEDIAIRSMGVPLANLGKPLLARRNRRLLGDGGLEAASPEERTAESGLHRALPLSDALYGLLFNRITLAPAILAQRALARTRLGVNWVAIATAPAHRA
ncbi:MAG: class I SAM-dependent methyltransferase [Coriobacteriia bacterium]|nr:class I SAM-dependent methyltransferase [Coriobacteriia bacterium]